MTRALLILAAAVMIAPAPVHAQEPIDTTKLEHIITDSIEQILDSSYSGWRLTVSYETDGSDGARWSRRIGALVKQHLLVAHQPPDTTIGAHVLFKPVRIGGGTAASGPGESDPNQRTIPMDVLRCDAAPGKTGKYREMEYEVHLDVSPGHERLWTTVHEFPAIACGR